MEPSTVLCVDETRAAVLQKYHEMLGVAFYKDRNPLPQPTSLERSHFPLFLQFDYMVSDKSDGTRYALFLTQVQGREMAVMIDRKLCVYQIPVAASRSHFQGSIYDGELVSANGTHVFIVFDCAASKGVYVGNKNFLDRLSSIRVAFDLEGANIQSAEDASKQAKKGKIICGGSTFGLSFRPKLCFQLRQLDTLLRQLPGLAYKTDGLVFTPVDDPISYGTHASLFKYKTLHSIDVEVGEGGELLVGCGGAPDTAVLRTPLTSLGINLHIGVETKQQIARRAGAILELALRKKEEAFELFFLCQRSDKGHPNAASTILRTIKNIKENITIQELLHVSQQAAESQDMRLGDR
jgi:hypothetical protein